MFNIYHLSLNTHTHPHQHTSHTYSCPVIKLSLSTGLYQANELHWLQVHFLVLLRHSFQLRLRCSTRCDCGWGGGGVGLAAARQMPLQPSVAKYKLTVNIFKLVRAKVLGCVSCRGVQLPVAGCLLPVACCRCRQGHYVNHTTAEMRWR